MKGTACPRADFGWISFPPDLSAPGPGDLRNPNNTDRGREGGTSETPKQIRVAGRRSRRHDETRIAYYTCGRKKKSAGTLNIKRPSLRPFKCPLCPSQRTSLQRSVPLRRERRCSEASGAAPMRDHNARRACCRLLKSSSEGQPESDSDAAACQTRGSPCQPRSEEGDSILSSVVLPDSSLAPSGQGAALNELVQLGLVGAAHHLYRCRSLLHLPAPPSPINSGSNTGRTFAHARFFFSHAARAKHPSKIDG